MQSGLLYRGHCVGIGIGDFYSHNEIILIGNILMVSVSCILIGLNLPFLSNGHDLYIPPALENGDPVTQVNMLHETITSWPLLFP